MKASDVVEGRGDKPAAASAGYAKRARRFGRIWLTVTRPFSRSIYVRFQYAFGLAVFGFVLLATITLISSRLLLNFFGETVWEARFEAEPAHYIQAALKETEHLAYAYAVEGDRSASAKFEAVAETVDNRFQKLTEAISLLGSLDHAHSDIAVPEVHKAWLGAQVILRRVFQHGAGSAEAVKALSRAHAAIDPVYDAMSQYHHGSMQNMQERLAAAHSVVQWAYLATMGAIVVGIVVLIGMGIVVGRSILQPIAQLQIAAQRLGKKDFYCRVKLRNTNDELGQLGRAFNTAAAILERLYEELRRRSTHDGLTGVLNRTAFDERLAVECKSADRHGRMTSLLMVDVDHFKRVNDTYGHQIGDRVLIDVVRLLTQLSRPGDIVARYGG